MASLEEGSGLDLSLLSHEMAEKWAQEAFSGEPGGECERGERLMDMVKCLETENLKIGVFKRELPITASLVVEVIRSLTEELSRCKSEERRTKAEGEDCADKMSWMSSAQLWSGSHGDAGDGNKKQTLIRENSTENCLRSNPPSSSLAGENTAAAVITPGISVPAPNSAEMLQKQQPGGQRKARRCWSQELHRRFLVALQQLGGAEVATPKQIRQLMKIEGLTNDEVKSHLQKYRLHTRRHSPASPFENRPGWESSAQSGSPQGPLQVSGSSQAVSATASHSCGEEDGASAGRSMN